jgi:hypothetical protein
MIITDFVSRTLGENQLTGEIPSSIGNLFNLQQLYVEEKSSEFSNKMITDFF